MFNSNDKKCSVKYVYIEMILSEKEDYVIVPGFFQGFKQYKDSNFVIVCNKNENSSAVLNLRYYDVLSIEYMKNSFRHINIYTKEKYDQDAAKKELIELYRGVVKEEDDPEIIDVLKYTDVPECHKSALPVASVHTKTTGSSNGGITPSISSHAKPPLNQMAAQNNKASDCSYTNGYNNYYNKYTNYTPPKSQPAVPTAFSRTDEKPSEEIMKGLLSKVVQVMTDSYEPQIPEVKHEGEQGEEGYQDYYEGFGY